MTVGMARAPGFGRGRSGRGWLAHQLTAVFLAVAAIGVGVSGSAAHRLDALQTRWDDGLQPGLDGVGDPGVVVVAIDRDTIAAEGGWPVARRFHADLVAAIGEGAPAVIVYDVLFASTQPGDAALAEAIGGVPTVLAAALTLAPQPGGPPVATRRLVPVPTLADAATAVGHTNVRLSPDSGVVRSIPLYAVDDRSFPIPSVAIAAVAIADGVSPTIVERPTGLQVGRRLIPAPAGDLAINWSQALGADRAIPARDVLAGAVPSATFRDRIVVVGVTEPTLGDQHLVPVDRSGSTSGVFVVANAINTIVSNGYLTEPARGPEILLVIGVGLVTALLFAMWRLSLAAAASTLVIAAVLGAATWRFHTRGEQWDVVWPTVTAVVVAATISGWRYLVEIRHRHRAWSLFATYVPAAVVAELATRDRLEDATRSARRPISVVFCDLRGFTPIAATLDPDDVRRLLEQYYEYAVAIIHRHGGTVMQFVGDEVFAVFGAPVDTPGAAAAAVRCAIELQDGVPGLDALLDDQGLPRIRFGIGVHRGLATTAHVGTTDRRQYSAIGDTVNVGSRLCGAARAGEIVASIDAVETVSRDATLGLERDGAIELKGVAAPVPVFRRSAPVG